MMAGFIEGSFGSPVPCYISINNSRGRGRRGRHFLILCSAWGALVIKEWL